MKKENVGSVKVIPLGGLEQIGMNITAIEYDDSIVVVDCGLSFPEEEMLGIDLIIPDVTYYTWPRGSHRSNSLCIKGS